MYLTACWVAILLTNMFSAGSLQGCRPSTGGKESTGIGDNDGFASVLISIFLHYRAVTHRYQAMIPVRRTATYKTYLKLILTETRQLLGTWKTNQKI